VIALVYIAAWLVLSAALSAFAIMVWRLIDWAWELARRNA
jgi:hypothetical protein